jgi:hypothetical protein
MLSEFEQIEHSFGAEKAADVRKTLHFLLRHQFVFAGDRGTTVAYNTIMDASATPSMPSSTAADTACIATPRRSGRASWPPTRMCRCRG